MIRTQHDHPDNTRFRFKLQPGSKLETAQLHSLNAIKGVIEVVVQSSSIIIQYDLMQTNLNLLLEALKANSIQPVIGPLQTFRFSLKCFTDQNIRDHSKHLHQCCGKQPKER